MTNCQRHLRFAPLILPFLLASCELGSSADEWAAQSAETRACRDGDVAVCIELCAQGDERACTRIPEVDCSSATKEACRAGDLDACLCLCDAGDERACARLEDSPNDGCDPPPDTTGRLTYRNGFSSGFGAIDPSERALTGDIGDDIDQMCSAGRKWSLEDPTGGNDPALKVLQSGDQSCLTGAETKPKHRAQFRWIVDGVDTPDGRIPLALNEHHWFGWSIWIPRDFPAQYYDANNQSVHHFGLQRETMVKLYGSGSTPMYNVANRYGIAAGSDAVAVDREQGVPLPTERWAHAVLHVYRAQDDTGIIEFWLDGEKKVDWRGIRTASATGAIGTDVNQTGTVQRFKIGLYWGTRDRPHDVSIYLDNLRYASGTDAYDLVDPTR